MIHPSISYTSEVRKLKEEIECECRRSEAYRQARNNDREELVKTRKEIGAINAWRFK